MIWSEIVYSDRLIIILILKAILTKYENSQTIIKYLF